MAKQLSKHFNSREFDCRDGTRVYAKDYDELATLCKTFLEPLRDRFGRVTVNSGFRTRSYNRKIGGASKSYHIYTEREGSVAADITCAKGGPRDWHRFLAGIRASKRNGRGGLGLYPRFCHVDTRPYKSDWRG